MGTLVRFGKQKAFLREGEWRCANHELETRLNEVTQTWIQQTGGPPVADRDHEQTVAQEIAERLDGRIITRVSPPSRKAAGVYVSLRQLHLDFS